MPDPEGPRYGSGEDNPDYTPGELLGMRLERCGRDLAIIGDRLTVAHLSPAEAAELDAIVADLETRWRAIGEMAP